MHAPSPQRNPKPVEVQLRSPPTPEECGLVESCLSKLGITFEIGIGEALLQWVKGDLEESALDQFAQRVRSLGLVCEFGTTTYKAFPSMKQLPQRFLKISKEDTGTEIAIDAHYERSRRMILDGLDLNVYVRRTWDIG